MTSQNTNTRKFTTTERERWDFRNKFKEIEINSSSIDIESKIK